MTCHCRLQFTQSTVADDVVLTDQIDVEEFLWRYIDRHYRHELDKACGASGVKYTYLGNVSPPQLVLESTDGSTVRDASERITCLCQKLAADVTDVAFPHPDGADRLAFRELADGLSASTKAVFYVDRKQICHVIGPKDMVGSVAREIEEAWRDDQCAIFGQVTTSKTTGVRTVTPAGVSVEVSGGQLRSFGLHLELA